jgi:hypothetical protein
MKPPFMLAKRVPNSGDRNPLFIWSASRIVIERSGGADVEGTSCFVANCQTSDEVEASPIGKLCAKCAVGLHEIGALRPMEELVRETSEPNY